MPYKDYRTVYRVPITSSLVIGFDLTSDERLLLEAAGAIALSLDEVNFVRLSQIKEPVQAVYAYMNIKPAHRDELKAQITESGVCMFVTFVLNKQNVIKAVLEKNPETKHLAKGIA